VVDSGSSMLLRLLDLRKFIIQLSEGSLNAEQIFIAILAPALRVETHGLLPRFERLRSHRRILNRHPSSLPLHL